MLGMVRLSRKNPERILTGFFRDNHITPSIMITSIGVLPQYEGLKKLKYAKNTWYDTIITEKSGCYFPGFFHDNHIIPTIMFININISPQYNR